MSGIQSRQQDARLGGGDDTVKLWDVASRTPIASLKGLTSSAQSVAFSPDGRSLAAADCFKSIKLWDLESGQAITTLPCQAF